MKQLIEDRYIGAKVGDTIGVVDRRGFIAPDGGGGGQQYKFFVEIAGGGLLTGSIEAKKGE